MPQLSIRVRLNLLIGALLVFALAANVAVIVWSAGPRIRAEDASIVRLAVETVERGLGEIQSSNDPARDLATLLDRLSQVRHAHVYFVPVAESRPTGRRAMVPQGGATGASPVPAWFSKLLYTERTPVRIAARIKGETLGTIVIASNPRDEVGEIWDAVSFTLTAGLALITAVFALTTWAVRQALMPVQNLGRALRLMKGGNYAVELAETGPPELAEISSKLNELAAALSQSRDDNSALTEQLITLEDQERRELARELHDEFGPYLFAVRANLSSMQAEAERDGTPAGAIRAKKCAATLDQIQALQHLNRRVLQRLRPPALAELGLDGALQGLVANWRANHAGTGIELLNSVEPGALDPTSELTVYRVVQEGLTNAFRHAMATQIRVEVSPSGKNRLSVRVADNGQGLAEGSKPGFGLSGMSDRVKALGGVIAFTNPPEGGFALEVALPMGTSTPVSKAT